MSAFINRILLLFVILLSFSCTNKQEIDSFYGTWSVKKYKFGNGVIAFDSKQQAANYINKKIILTSDKAEIFGDQCLKPSYAVSKKNTKDLFYQEFRESDSAIIPATDSVTFNVISCISQPSYKNKDSLNFIYNLILLNKKEMMTSVNGAYFYLDKE